MADSPVRPNSSGSSKAGSQLLRYDKSKGSLQNQLSRAMVRLRDHDHDRGYLPDGELSRLVCKEAVEEVLRGFTPSTRPLANMDIAAEAQEICRDTENYPSTSNGHEKEIETQLKPRSYRKVFAVLLLIERVCKIRRFVKEAVCDADLPLVVDTGSFSLRRKGRLDVPLRCFKGWTQSALTQFEERQWIVLAPHFSWRRSPVIHHDFCNGIILPFTSWTKLKRASGMGQVFKVEIHADHHSLDTGRGNNRFFAIKRLKSEEHEDFNREVSILRGLNKEHHAHPNLISLLATYKQHGIYYLIFPWAEADLIGYWMDINPSPSHDSETIMWLAEQCVGLASGLAKIHRYETLSGSSLLNLSFPRKSTAYHISVETASDLGGEENDTRIFFGRHGDIKPSNILWFPDTSGEGRKGGLKITDFGIAHFKTKDYFTFQERGRAPNSPTYRCPEWDTKDEIASTSYDIWALGCVYLEFITWYFGGYKYQREFGRKRLTSGDAWGEDEVGIDTFFTVEKSSRKPIVKPAVTEFIRDLYAHTECTDFFRKFLAMIEEEILIVEEKLPDGSKVGRKSAAHIARDLQEIIQRTLKNGGAKGPILQERIIGRARSW
ncbi:kinase-like domain-containing protein [Nemania sp. FL0031]|nr:kinase-like domain-containing protein [Nemania sp. FL0031]